MGVPLNTLLSFFVCQILGLGPASGLPFSSLSSIPSLQTLENLPTGDTSETLNSISNLDTELASSSLVPGTLSSKSCQLFIGSPEVNINIFSSTSPSLLINNNNEQISTADIPDTNVFNSFNLQSNTVSPNTDAVSSCSLLDANPDSTSGLSIIPSLNIDFNSDSTKRDLRDTVSVLEPCPTNASPNRASALRPNFTPNYVINSPFSSFPIMPTPKPIIKCQSMPENLTEASNEQDSDTSLNAVETDCLSNSDPSQPSSLLTNDSPSSSSSLQNNLVFPQDNSNVLTPNSASNRISPRSCNAVANPAQSCLLRNRFNLQQNALSSDCTESCQNPSGSLYESLSSFAEVRNYINSRKLNSGIIQNQPSETNACPCQVNQINNNLMYAKALQNKIASEEQVSQIITNNVPICNNNIQNSQNSESSCENTINNGLAAYENVFNIRNNVIPKLQLENAVVKNIAQNTMQNNNANSLSCPQIEAVSVEDSLPLNQNNNILLNPTNICLFANNNNVGNAGQTITFANDETSQINSNQGCPQLMSIPVYNVDFLQNKQTLRLSSCDFSPNQSNNLNIAQASLGNNVQFCNNPVPINQNNFGSPELLAIAQNKLNTRNNYETNVNNIQDQYCNCVDEKLVLQPDNNCNDIQTLIPNDNLVQALRLINEAKLNQPVKGPAASINILPFGQTIIDGTPVSNLVAPGLVESTSLDSCKSNNFFTIQDVSKPVPFIPVNPFSYCTPEVPVQIPTNIILTPPFSFIDNGSPFVTNVVPPVVNMPPVPIITNIRSVEAPVTQLFLNNQDILCNNIQPILTLMDNNVNNCPTNPFIPIQSLPKVSFVNNISPSISGTVSLPDNFISSIPCTCNSIKLLPPSSYSSSITAANLPQTNSIPGSSTLYPCLNNIVSTLTQNIISRLKTKVPATGIPVALPPVTPSPLTETPFCLDTATTLNLARPLDMPVACNEYLPPLTLIPLTSFNSDLFCIESDESFDSCSPFALSKTDAYYPEQSFVSSGPSDCSSLCGPLFMPVSSLPQSSSVLKINNTGREARCYEQLVKSIVL